VGAWITSRNRQRDQILRTHYEKIAASRGIAIVDQPLLVLRGHSRPVNQVAFSPTARASPPPGVMAMPRWKLWDSQTGEILRP